MSVSDASARITPPPGISIGRSACSSIATASRMAAGFGAGFSNGSARSQSGSQSTSGPFWMFSGRSISTGPGRPSLAIRNACRNTHGICAVSFTCTAHLVTGLAISTMSTAWKASLCRTSVGAWPVMQIIGIESAIAV
jgi:hypothetical protein